MSYTVFEDRPTGSATVHRATCRQIRKNGGSRRVPPNSWYHEGLSTAEVARDVALDTGRRHVRDCSFCHP